MHISRTRAQMKDREAAQLSKPNTLYKKMGWKTTALVKWTGVLPIASPVHFSR